MDMLQSSKTAESPVRLESLFGSIKTSSEKAHLDIQVEHKDECKDGDSFIIIGASY